MISNPGTPSDWTNPETYVPPSLRAETEAAEARSRASRWQVLKLTACVSVASYGVMSFVGAVADEVDRMAEEAALEESDIDPNAPYQACPRDDSVTWQDVAKDDGTAGLRFALGEDELLEASTRLSAEQTQASAEAIGDQIFERWGIDYHIGDLPDSTELADQALLAGFEHQPADLDDQLAWVSTRNIMYDLSRLPDSLMRELAGTDIILTTGLGDDTAGNYTPGPREALITVDAEADIDSGSVFLHEVSHALHFKICGNSEAYSDIDYQSLNPEKFIYSDDVYQLTQAIVGMITVSQYGATNVVEDVAESSQRLLDMPIGTYLDCVLGGRPVICQKGELILQRWASVEPEIARYIEI